MIYAALNQPEFEYDIHSLLKAFFPKEEVEITYTDPEALKGKRLAWTNHVAAKCAAAEAVTAENSAAEAVTAENSAAENAASEGASAEAAASEIKTTMVRDMKNRAENRDKNGINHDTKNREYKTKAEKDDKNEPQGSDMHLEVTYGEAAITLFWREAGNRVSFSIDPQDRIAAKNALKQHLYRMLEKETGSMLPWGSLTGIRPTKIPMKLLQEGASEDAIFAYMRDTYYASDKKIALSIEIAKRELALLSRLDCERGYSLYIGIPFCPSTCLYCSFTSYPLSAWKKRVDTYLDALEQEIEDTAERMKDSFINSVYIGGGTPTTLEPYQLERLISKIKSCFDLSKCLEFTVEAGRPDSITEEKLLVLKEQGIGRISINPQTMKQETLELIGRHHTVEQTVESFFLARKLGFDNINMDLIVGLPDETLSDVRDTMERIRELSPDNVTVHSLAVKRAARLTIWKERYQDMQMVNTAEHMELTETYCRSMGLSPYYLYRQKGMAGNMENVGYAAEGKAGVYNILIMEEVQSIVALGAGSVSKRVYPDGTIKRCENVKDVSEYINRIKEMIERKHALWSSD